MYLMICKFSCHNVTRVHLQPLSRPSIKMSGYAMVKGRVGKTSQLDSKIEIVCLLRGTHCSKLTYVGYVDIYMLTLCIH